MPGILRPLKKAKIIFNFWFVISFTEPIDSAVEMKMFQWYESSQEEIFFKIF